MLKRGYAHLFDAGLPELNGAGELGEFVQGLKADVVAAVGEGNSGDTTAIISNDIYQTRRRCRRCGLAC